MNVGQLREMIENVDDEVEVVIATQPSWPLATRVSNVMLNSERDEYDETEGRDGPEDDLIEVLWIAADGATRAWDSPYAPSDVFSL